MDGLVILGVINAVVIAPIYFILGSLMRDVRTLKDHVISLERSIGVLEGRTQE